MRTILYTLLLVAVSFACNAKGVGAECIKELHELEESLLSRQSNIDTLTEAFFPVNRHESITVDAYYYSNGSLEGSRAYLNLEDEQHDYLFLWTASPVNIFIRPSLLQPLSLFIFQDDSKPARLIVDPICDGISENTTILDRSGDSDPCFAQGVEEIPLQVRLLNQLTAQLKVYTLEREPTVDEDNRGYTAYFFNRNNTNEFCVVLSEAFYRDNRWLIFLALVFLEFFVAIGTPAAIYYTYEPIRLHARRKGSNVQYFLWSILILSPVLVLGVFAIDIYTLIDFGLRRERSSQTDIVANFALAGAALIFFLILDVVLTGLLVSTGILKSDFPIPPSLTILCSCSCAKKFLQSIVIYSFMLGVQLLSFHTIYVFLGLIASPTQAITILAFYITGSFCLITCVAVFLKLVKVQKSSLEGFDQSKCKSFFKRLVGVVVGVLFLGFVVSFIAFFLQVVVLVGDQGSGQVNAFVGALVPSVILGVLGVAGKRIVEFELIGEADNKEKDIETGDK